MYSWKKGLALTDIPPEQQANVRQIVNRALASGINHFETAPYYGTGEIQLGEALAHHPRDSYILQVKIDPQVDKGEFKDQLSRSLQTLGVQQVDLLTLHGINNVYQAEWALRSDGGADWMRELRDSGLCRAIGFSTHGSCGHIRRLIASNSFDYVFLHYYFLDQSNTLAVQDCAERDLGVSIISPNLMGGQLFAPTPQLAELCSPLHPMEFNTLFLLFNPGVHCLSLGVKEPDELQLHLDIASDYQAKCEVYSAVLSRVQQRITEVMGAGWMELLSRGLPDWEPVPGGVNVPQILRLETMRRAFGMDEFCRTRYNALGRGSHWNVGEKISPHTVDAVVGLLPAANRQFDLKALLLSAHAAMDGEATLRRSES